jgi:hypothetical protein
LIILGKTVKYQVELEMAQAISHIFWSYNKRSLTSMYDLNLTSSLHVRSDGYLLLTVKETIQIE